jgi:hypothetical protein
LLESRGRESRQWCCCCCLWCCLAPFVHSYHRIRYTFHGVEEICLCESLFPFVLPSGGFLFQLTTLTNIPTYIMHRVPQETIKYQDIATTAATGGLRQQRPTRRHTQGRRAAAASSNHLSSSIPPSHVNFDAVVWRCKWGKTTGCTTATTTTIASFTVT